MRKLKFTIVNRAATLLLLLALAPPAFGVGVNLAWDPRPASDSRTFVRIFERTGAAAPYIYTQVAQVAEPATSFTLATVSPGIHVYVVRGYNGQGESPDSNAVTTIVLTVPGTITNLTATFVP